MIKLTYDVYSGRPNPEVIVLDEQESLATLREVAKDRALLDSASTTDVGLGFRGVAIEALSDDFAERSDMPPSLYIPAAAAKQGRVAEHLERLIELAKRGAATAAADSLDPLLDFLKGQLGGGSRVTLQDRSREPMAQPQDEAMDVTCSIESGTFNPGFWNNDATIRQTNNCYNYGSNKRTNTFAQPGKGCGHMYTAITCAEVTRAALCDGLHRRFDCFPDAEKPRWLMALVVAPGPGFVDYHWYRRSKEGFWGHKPGSTAARNTDNSNRVITDPSTCDRGPYVHFCGYFYSCKTQQQRIK